MRENYRIHMDNKVVDVYETNALFYKVYVHTDITDNGELYVSVGSGDIEVEAWADTNQYDDEVFTLITDDLESQLDGVMARYERSSKDTPDEILDAIEELYDYLEGVNEMWTNYDAWSEVDEETTTEVSDALSYHKSLADLPESKYFLVTKDGVEVEAPFDKWWSVVNHEKFDDDRNERITSSVERKHGKDITRYYFSFM